MDRQLEPKRFTAGRVITVALVLAAGGALAYTALRQSSGTHLSVDPARMTTAEVTHGEFREYYPFDGRVEPKTTVYLDVEEGGKVEQVLLRGGHTVEAGDLILKFSNTALQRSSIEAETRLLENLDQLRNTQFNRAQSELILKDQLLDLTHQIEQTAKDNARYESLMTENAVARETYETTRDQLTYLKAKRELLERRIAQETELNDKQLAQANKSIDRVQLNLDLLQRIVDSLEVRAPISGFLSSIDVEVGQNVGPGQRIGQIDQLDAFKVRVSIDQYYISRVEEGTPGKFDLDGKSYPVKVTRIYPEVVNDAFAVDVDFAGTPPPSLRRGQRLTVELSFSEPTMSLVVAKGGFYQSGGRYVYLIAPDRMSARRASVRIGRQNPRQVEVLEGLEPGDWIVTSGYDTFNEADELKFPTPIELID